MGLYYVWFDPELNDNCAMEADELNNTFVKLKNTLIKEGIHLELVQAEDITSAQQSGTPLLHMVAGHPGSEQQIQQTIYKNQTNKH
jgi:hypothetical protein